MKVLIVDDQYDSKVKAIAKNLNLLNNISVKHVLNARDAYNELLFEFYDLLLIDLQIPESFGDDIDVNGGFNFLELICNDTDIHIPTTIVGITGHLDAYNENVDKFNTKGWTLHFFNGDTNFINDILEGCLRRSKIDQKYDVAFITALRHTEFESLLANGMRWTELDVNDCNKYYTAVFNDKNGVPRKAVATYCSSMGMAISAAISMKVILKFNPELLIMTGIAAGVEGKVNLGDVLIADKVWDWGSGKTQDSESGTTLLNDPNIIDTDEKLSSEMKDISSKRLYVDKIKSNFQGNTPQNSLSIHVGALASGASVLADSKTIDLIKAQKRSVIGVEMEAFGVVVASKLCGIEGVKALIIKSACDFASSEKNDDWQKYSAYTSTSVATEIIKNHINFK
ncbi:MAG: nucleoside phosphorylase/CheY-like chemotaxis protein [Cocleimonas sp.]|jgi:nucleoside phosphorylase/CheY-like chemotaxis protein